MSSQGLSRHQVDRMYRPKGYHISPALTRARAPFRVPNALTGLAVASFAVGVWAYSISAVKQDDFSDVDEEARGMLRDRGKVDAVSGSRGVGLGAGTGAKSMSTPAADAVSPARSIQGQASPSSASASSTPSRSSPPPLSTTTPRNYRTGILAPLLAPYHSHLLDPERGTFVWGAPPVDNVGRLGDRPKPKPPLTTSS